jgi:hypothetical protein
MQMAAISVVPSLLQHAFMHLLWLHDITVSACATVQVAATYSVGPFLLHHAITSVMQHVLWLQCTLSVHAYATCHAMLLVCSVTTRDRVMTVPPM